MSNADWRRSATWDKGKARPGVSGRHFAGWRDGGMASGQWAAGKAWARHREAARGREVGVDRGRHSDNCHHYELWPRDVLGQGIRAICKRRQAAHQLYRLQGRSWKSVLASSETPWPARAAIMVRRYYYYGTMYCRPPPAARTLPSTEQHSRYSLPILATLPTLSSCHSYS